MQLRIVDAACQPVKAATVEVWHTNHTAGYSGQIVQMCNNDQTDLTRQFFRGWQRTNQDGIVRFDSCLPRLVLRPGRVCARDANDYDPDDVANAWLTIQLLFSDTLNQSILSASRSTRTQGNQTPDWPLTMS